MSVARILHLADVHLDTVFLARDENLRHKLRQGTRQAFETAMDVALDRDVHGVLIAGDLFDNQRLSLATERFLVLSLKRLEAAGIPVCYATGNHDPGQAGTRRENLAWPENVTVFHDPRPVTVPLLDKQGRQTAWLTGAGHGRQREGRNLAQAFPRARTDLPHVAMLHTQVLSCAASQEYDCYAPCSELDLECSGFAYWALGHVHQRQRASRRVPAWYPGNIQGRNPKEQGLKGCLYVEVGPQGPEKVDFIPLAPLIWHWLELDCPQEPTSLDSLVASLVEEVRSRTCLDDGRDHLIRLDLKGQSPLAADIAREDNLQELSETLQAELGVLWLEARPRGLVQPVDVESFHGSATVLGEALTIVDELRQDPERIRDLGGLALSGGPEAEDRQAYVRKLLQGMDGELAAWVLNRTKP